MHDSIRASVNDCLDSIEVIGADVGGAGDVARVGVHDVISVGMSSTFLTGE